MRFLNQVTAKYSTIKVTHDDNEMKVELPGYGKAYGEFHDIQDEDDAMTMPPLGLDAYGDKEGRRIFQKIEDISYIFYLHGMEVNPESRAKGYGKMLLDRVEDEAKKAGVDAVMANASPMGSQQVPFVVLQKFYTDNGYEFLTIYKSRNGLIYKRMKK